MRRRKPKTSFAGPVLIFGPMLLMTGTLIYDHATTATLRGYWGAYVCYGALFVISLACLAASAMNYWKEGKKR
jgi:uncharacterized membrane protein